MYKKDMTFYRLAVAMCVMGLIDMSIIIYNAINKIPSPIWIKVAVPVLLFGGYLCALVSMEDED